MARTGGRPPTGGTRRRQCPRPVSVPPADPAALRFRQYTSNRWQRPPLEGIAPRRQHLPSSTRILDDRRGALLRGHEQLESWLQPGWELVGWPYGPHELAQVARNIRWYQ